MKVIWQHEPFIHLLATELIQYDTDEGPDAIAVDGKTFFITASKLFKSLFCKFDVTNNPLFYCLVETVG